MGARSDIANRADQARAFIARYARDTGRAPATWMVALYLDTTPKHAGRILREMAGKQLPPGRRVHQIRVSSHHQASASQ